MLIVCTKDPTIVDWTNNSESGAQNWGDIIILDAKSSQVDATKQLKAALKKLDDPLCLSAHGSDTEIGDEGSGGKYWTWSCSQIASYLGSQVPGSYQGPILIHACAKNVSNFSARLAVALENQRALNGAWIYGYNTAIGSDQRYPEPRLLDSQADLQPTVVNYY